VKIPLACALALSLACVRPLWRPNPNLDVFGQGPLTNLGEGDRAQVNASAHASGAVAVTLIGAVASESRCRGAVRGAAAQSAFALGYEAFYHAPDQPGAAYPSELRTGLLTLILPAWLMAGAVCLWGPK
jgi:hypothetical protein